MTDVTVSFPLSPIMCNVVHTLSTAQSRRGGLTQLPVMGMAVLISLFIFDELNGWEAK
jgi:hypothetical protein